LFAARDRFEDGVFGVESPFVVVVFAVVAVVVVVVVVNELTDG
jgi:hypothetical protein